METYVWLDKSWRGRRNGQMSRQLLRPKESAQDDHENTKKFKNTDKQKTELNFPWLPTSHLLALSKLQLHHQNNDDVGEFFSSWIESFQSKRKKLKHHLFLARLLGFAGNSVFWLFWPFDMINIIISQVHNPFLINTINRHYDPLIWYTSSKEVASPPLATQDSQLFAQSPQMGFISQKNLVCNVWNVYYNILARLFPSEVSFRLDVRSLWSTASQASWPLFYPTRFAWARWFHQRGGELVQLEIH